MVNLLNQGQFLVLSVHFSCHYICIYYILIAECQGKDVKECCEKPTKYTHCALLDIDSVYFSRDPRNSSRLWTQDFMMNIEYLVISNGIYILFETCLP